MKKYIYILLAIFLMLVGCKKEEIVVDNQIKVGLVKLEVEVAKEEWYAIDNIKIYDGIPSHAEDDINFE